MTATAEILRGCAVPHGGGEGRAGGESAPPASDDAAPRPCPFCGDQPGIEHHAESDEPGWSVYCASQRCNVYVVAGPVDTRDKAIALWNRRAIRV